MRVRSLGRTDPLQEVMATHSSILAWRIPRTEEPGGLQFMGPQSQTRLKQLSTQQAYVTLLLSLSEMQAGHTPLTGPRKSQTPG